LQHQGNQPHVELSSSSQNGLTIRIRIEMSISENIRFAVRDAGEVSAILLRPQNAESLLVLAHGAGQRKFGC